MINLDGKNIKYNRHKLDFDEEEQETEVLRVRRNRDVDIKAQAINVSRIHDQKIALRVSECAEKNNEEEIGSDENADILDYPYENAVQSRGWTECSYDDHFFEVEYRVPNNSGYRYLKIDIVGSDGFVFDSNIQKVKIR